MHPSTQLLIIDPQNDFCDLPASWWPTSPLTGQPLAPALPVTGAHADMQRLAQWINRQGERLDAITLTLDSHQAYDIAHPAFWQQADGSAVAPFTRISAEQLRSDQYQPRDPAVRSQVLAYLDQLQAQGRYELMVWPLHCEIGSWGHGVHEDILRSCRQWQEQRQRAVHNVFKGMNPWTEHYSAICAEVPDESDPDTGINQVLLDQLRRCDQLVIAGEASSHCVRATTEHIAQHSGMAPERLVLLIDCMSPVAGFEAAHTEFVEHMRAIGVRCETSTGFEI